MDTNNALFERKPQSATKKLLIGTAIFIVIYLLVAGLSFNPIVITIGVIALVFILLLNENQYYDGLIISTDFIIISKNSIFKGTVQHELPNKDIERITYAKAMHRTPQHLIIESGIKPTKLRVMISDSIFKFAYILRELKQNGMNIQIHGGDHEVQLFLDGRIPDLPMTNDMEIR